MKSYWVAAALSLMVFSISAFSQDYPNKPIRIVTAAAGGGSDFIARQVGQGISGPLGQAVVVDNRGSGVLAAEAVAKMPPDGYALTVQGSGVWSVTLLQKMPYDAVKDFAPISLLTRQVSILAVHPSLQVKSVKELVDLAKAKPGQLNYSSASAGGAQHLSMELLKSMASIDVVRIPYKGNAPAVTGVIAGEAQFTIFDVGNIAPHVKAGKLRALAVTSATPSALAPGLPTVTASGVPGYEWIGVSVLLAPANTPSAIITRLNRETVRTLTAPDVKERLLATGEEVIASTPEELAAYIKADMTKTAKVIKDANIKLE